MSKYRIITFDGGGVRSIFSIILLNRISSHFNDFFKSADLYSGASAGAIIALALSLDIAPEKLYSAYSLRNIEYVFSAKYLGLNRPLYSNALLYRKLSSLFTEYLTLKDLEHKVLIPSFDLLGSEETGWKSDLFNNFPDSEYLDMRIIDAAMCSTACPIYFPSYKNHIDGGIIANNPSSIALAFAISKLSDNLNIKNIRLLSFGSGCRHYSINTETSHWGALQWALDLNTPLISPILSIVSAGISDSNYQAAKLLLGDNCFRIDPRLLSPIRVDQFNKIPILKKIAYSYDISPLLKWLEEKWL